MPKEVRINVRTSPQIKRDLETTAELKGMTVSALVNWAVVNVIREEKDREPRAFVMNAHPGELKITGGKATMTKSGVPKEIQDADLISHIEFQGKRRRGVSKKAVDEDVAKVVKRSLRDRK